MTGHMSVTVVGTLLVAALIGSASDERADFRVTLGVTSRKLRAKSRSTVERYPDEHVN